MIELRALPLDASCGTVAVLREPGRHVVRILGSLEILQVAARALHGVPAELAADVALGALQPSCARRSAGSRLAEWSNFAPCH